MDASSSNDCLSRLLINVSCNPFSFHPPSVDPTCLLDGLHFRDTLETCPVHCLHLYETIIARILSTLSEGMLQV